MSRFAVLLAGPARPTAPLRAALAGRRVIAADGGIVHAGPLGVVPELWVGDFDSVPAGLGPEVVDVAREAAPREKDETDAALAVAAARARGASDILLVGALRGPRSDHAFSNLVLALGLARQGCRVALFDGSERALPLGPETLRVAAAPGQTFSILRFGPVEGLTVAGARWPLEGVELPFHSILTQSNEALGPIEVRLVRGEAILLLQEEGTSEADAPA